MGICATELRDYVIRPVLKSLGMYTPAAEVLLLGTAAVETGLGSHLKVKHHRGLGVYRIDPLTHLHIWDTHLVFNEDLASKVRGLASQHGFLATPHAELATNLSYSTAIARLIYQRVDKPIPNPDDLPALANYWRKFYHKRNDCTQNDFIQAYQAHVLNARAA